MNTTQPNRDGNTDDQETLSAEIDITRDYYMDPEVAEETGEDPVDTLLTAYNDPTDVPIRVREHLEMNILYGENPPAGDELPEIGDTIPFGRVTFTPDGEVVEFERYGESDEGE